MFEWFNKSCMHPSAKHNIRPFKGDSGFLKISPLVQVLLSKCLNKAVCAVTFYQMHLWLRMYVALNIFINVTALKWTKAKSLTTSDRSVLFEQRRETWHCWGATHEAQQLELAGKLWRIMDPQTAPWAKRRITFARPSPLQPAAVTSYAAIQDRPEQLFLHSFLLFFPFFPPSVLVHLLTSKIPSHWLVTSITWLFSMGVFIGRRLTIRAVRETERVVQTDGHTCALCWTSSLCSSSYSAFRPFEMLYQIGSIAVVKFRQQKT